MGLVKTLHLLVRGKQKGLGQSLWLLLHDVGDVAGFHSFRKLLGVHVISARHLKAKHKLRFPFWAAPTFPPPHVTTGGHRAQKGNQRLKAGQFSAVGGVRMTYMSRPLLREELQEVFQAGRKGPVPGEQPAVQRAVTCLSHQPGAPDQMAPLYGDRQ